MVLFLEFLEFESKNGNVFGIFVFVGMEFFFSWLGMFVFCILQCWREGKELDVRESGGTEFGPN